MSQSNLQSTDPSIRLVVWGLSFPENANIVRRLQADPDVSLVAWFGVAADCTHDIRDFFDFKADYDYKTPAVTEALYRAIYPDMAKFMEMFTRHNRDEQRRPIPKYDFHDYLHIFNRFIYFFADLLLSRRVNRVLFASIPHEGPDFVLYRLARILGIPTLILYQTLFPNRYMVMSELDDFGSYGHRSRQPLDPPIRLEKREALYYMNQLKRPRFDQKALWQVLKKGFFTKLCRREYQDLLARAPYITKYLNYCQYERNTAAMTDPHFSFEAPYVYFPLHYQPEMTTSGLSDIYADQALALERLARFIPPDWLIYAKDHVIQTEFMRGDWFFQRLRRISNLRFVPIETSTFELINHAQFVATITGTAGWEAIKNGKKALIFGKAWYQNLPGVFRYHENLDWQAFQSARINLDEVEREANALVSEMEIGVIETTAIPLVPDFDQDANAVLVSQRLLMLFREVPAQASSASLALSGVNPV